MEIQNEGVPVLIRWHLLVKGSSFFIPTLQPEELIKEVRKAATKRDIRLIHHICVDKGFYGVRFWREL